MSSQCLHVFVRTGEQCTSVAKKAGYCLKHHSNHCKKQRLVETLSSATELQQRVAELEALCQQQQQEILGIFFLSFEKEKVPLLFRLSIFIFFLLVVFLFQ